MSGFDGAWLALREPADQRARNAELASALAARFALRNQISVVDLGCANGANLRALAELLPPTQSWTLVDDDPAVLAAARTALATWSDNTTAEGEDGLILAVKGRTIRVRFAHDDLKGDLGAVLGETPDLVTAAAFFDRTSPQFIRRLAQAVVARRAVFYGVLTYNGIQQWTPRWPSDNQMTGAFNRYQMRDRGFGPSAGPTAPTHLADQFRIAGYAVQEGGSPWKLAGTHDAQLIATLASRHAAAIGETGALDHKTITQWCARPHTKAEIGHTDTLAVPA